MYAQSIPPQSQILFLSLNLPIFFLLPHNFSGCTICGPMAAVNLQISWPFGFRIRSLCPSGHSDICIFVAISYGELDIFHFFSHLFIFYFFFIFPLLTLQGRLLKPQTGNSELGSKHSHHQAYKTSDDKLDPRDSNFPLDLMSDD